MNTKRCVSAVSAVLATLLVAGTSFAEIIEIRTGQVGGVPGTPPASDHVGPVDDCFRALSATACAVPLSASAFTAADFQAARSGSPAELVVPAGAWLPALPADAAARWINWNHGTVIGGSGDPARSALYACDFAVETLCPSATLECWWSVDDRLGDAAGPNPIGFYLNGVPLPPAFAGGSLGVQSYASTQVTLNPGANTLYVYAADTACAVSGFILSCRITCDQPGEIHGTKYWDQDCDGTRDAGEPGLGGWTIALSGPVDTTVTTNPSGDYFVVVPPGTYEVAEVTQPCWILTDPPTGTHTVTVDCFQVVSGVDFGNCQCEEPSQPLPSCIAAWYPFDEGSGSTTRELATGNVATVSGPTWVTPGWLPPAHLDFPSAGDFVDASPPPHPSFGTGDFSASCWIRTSNPNPGQRTILDKTVAGLPADTGWHLYLQGGRLGVDLADGALATPYLSSGTTLTDGLWHHVAAVVCRDTGPGTGGVVLYVDGVVDASFPSAGMPVGSYDANVPLRIGERSPSMPPSGALAAELDEIMLFKDCCLDSMEVAALGSLRGFASGQCEVPSTVSACGSTVTTTLKICNNAAVPRTYTWTIAGNPSGGNCTVAGPISFTPAAGTVSVAAGTCQTIPITIAVPIGLTGTNVACYTATVLEQETGRCFKCDGSVRAPTWLWATPNLPFDDVPVGEIVNVEFTLQNTGPDAMFLDLELRPWSRGDDGPSPTLGLDGLPPGEPVVRTVKLPPKGIEPVTVGVRFEEHQAFTVHEVQLLADPHGTGELEVVAVTGLNSVPGPGTVGSPLSIAPAARRIRAAPNPFANGTVVHFELVREQAVSLRVYDVNGRLIRTLLDDRGGAGPHVVSWDGRTESGRAVAAGVYWIKLESPGERRATSVVRLR